MAAMWPLSLALKYLKRGEIFWKGKEVVDVASGCIHALGPTEKRVTLDASLADSGRVPAVIREARRGRRQAHFAAVCRIVALHDRRQRFYILDENLSNVSQVREAQVKSALHSKLTL